MHGMIKSRAARPADKGGSKASRSRKSVRAADTAGASATFRITPRIDRALTNLVKLTGRPKSYHTRRALERYVEDTYDYLVAVGSIRKSRKIYSSGEVRTRLGLSGKA